MILTTDEDDNGSAVDDAFNIIGPNVVIVSLPLTAGATARHQAIAGNEITDEQTQTRAMKQAALFGVIRPG